MKPSVIIETERLSLRPPAVQDAGAIFAQYARDAEVTKYLTWRPDRSVEETKEFLRRTLEAMEQGASRQWVIMRKEDGGLLGIIGFRVDGHKAELGYVLAREFWGRGYMTEAARAVVEWVFGRTEIYRLWAVCDVENSASARVMEKIGMRREGILRRWSLHPNRSNEPRDCYCYSITK